METVAQTTCSHFDYFIMTASSNIRGATAYHSLINQGVSIDNLIVLNFDFTVPSKSSLDQYNVYCMYLQLPNARTVNCHSYNDCSDYFGQLPINEKNTIGIDMTGFLTPDFLKTLYVLKEIKCVCRLDIFYTESNNYFSFSSYCDTYHYFDGEINYSVLNEYYTSSNDKEEVLVCFLGLEKNLSNYVNDIVNPSRTIAINGLPAYYPKMKDYSLLNNYELLSKIGKENVLYTIANNPFASYNILCEISKDSPNSILNICVLGNKPMALGACYYALNHPGSSKISYPYPTRYKLDTSQESNNCWHYEIDFC